MSAQNKSTRAFSDPLDRHILRASTKDSARVMADALDALGRVAEAAAIIARYGLGQDR